EPVSVRFNAADGLQVLYRVGSFEANLARSLVLLWVRLGFLAMLGLTAGTFLGFPVACVLSLMVYTAAALSGYLHESLTQYVALGVSNDMTAFDQLVSVPAQFFGQLAEGHVWEAAKILIRL